MGYVGDIVVPFPHHGGTKSQTLWLVAHSLECEAIPGLGEDLARGYFQNSQVSVHTVSDPRNNVGGLDTSIKGWHAGNTGNNYGSADEVTGRAAWTRAEWLQPARRAALENQWKAMAQLGVAAGFRPEEYRWLSIAQVRSMAVRGCCSHNDISEAFGESTHWDPGWGYPYDIAIQTIRWYAGPEVAAYWGEHAGPAPDRPSRPGPGGADPSKGYDGMPLSQADVDAVWDKHFEDVNGKAPGGGASVGDILNAVYTVVRATDSRVKAIDAELDTVRKELAAIRSSLPK